MIDFEKVKQTVGGKKITLGAVLKSDGSTVATKTGGWRSLRPVTDFSKCVKCGNCWTFCPDASYKKNEKGYFEVNLDYCKGCGICSEVCPVKCISMVREEK